MKGIPGPIYIRDTSSLQLKSLFMKGFQLYATHVEDSSKCKSPSIEEFPMLQEFVDVFKEILRLPPKRGIYFYIDLMPRDNRISKTPYRMGTLELNVGATNEIRIIIKEGVYMPKFLYLGRTNTLCKEERWNFEDVH
jgi:hypothetical protein